MHQLHNTYRFLNPSLPAAIACVRVYAELEALNLKPGRLMHPRLLRIDGVDECLVVSHSATSHLFTLHGGQGVRSAFIEWISTKGLREDQSLRVDDSFATGFNYADKALALIPGASHEAALRILIEASQFREWPADHDRKAFADAWPVVVKHLSLPRVALVGAPNAGKSSLFNQLSANRSTIVNEAQGTTRDWIEGHCVLPDGFACTVIDTAGIRQDTATESEAIGISLGQAEAARADFRLRLISCEDWRAGKALANDDPNILTIFTKSDLAAPPAGAFFLSSKDDSRVQELKALLVERLFPPLPSIRPLPLNAEMAAGL